MGLDRLRSDELVSAWLGDRCTPMQIALLGVFDPAPFRRPDGGVDVERIRSAVADRAACLAPLRRRVVRTCLGEGRPVWAPDPCSVPLRHVECATLPAGTDLGTWAADRAARPLEPDRPLWRAEVVDGLPDGRFAVLVVVSHVLADGLTGVALAARLLDRRRDARRVIPPADPVPPLPTHRDLRRQRLREIAAALRRARPPSRRVAARWWRAARRLREEMAGFAGREPATSLPRRIGPRRALAVVRLPLGELEEAGSALDVTVNDLLLASVAAGLAELLSARGQPVAGLWLRAMVPAATRPGEQVTAMLVVALPVGEPDPLRRLALVHRATARGKARLRAVDGSVLDLRLPSPVARPLVRWGRRFSSRRITLSVADVPGPPGCLWLAGARLEDVVPIAPLAPLVPLSVAALSYDGVLAVSVNADAAVPDVDVLADGLARGWSELQRRARSGVLPALPVDDVREQGPPPRSPGPIRSA